MILNRRNPSGCARTEGYTRLLLKKLKTMQNSMQAPQPVRPIVRY
jgi:hypothetical protein